MTGVRKRRDTVRYAELYLLHLVLATTPRGHGPFPSPLRLIPLQSRRLLEAQKSNESKNVIR